MRGVCCDASFLLYPTDALRRCAATGGNRVGSVPTTPFQPDEVPMSKSKLLSKFRTDESKEEAGVWVDFGDGIRVRVRRLKSRKSIEFRKELDKPHADVIRRGSMDDKTAEDLLIRQIAGGVIADWEGVEDEDADGNAIAVPYTFDNAYSILKKASDFRDEILSVSVGADNYRNAVDKDAVGNSSTS